MIAFLFAQIEATRPRLMAAVWLWHGGRRWKPAVYATYSHELELVKALLCGRDLKTMIQQDGSGILHFS